MPFSTLRDDVVMVRSETPLTVLRPCDTEQPFCHVSADL